MGQGHGDVARNHASGARDEPVPLSPSGALGADGGAASAAQHILPGGVRRVDYGAGALPSGDGAALRDGPLRVKVETEATSPTRPDVAAAGETTSGALSVPSNAVDGGTPSGDIGDLPPGSPGGGRRPPVLFSGRWGGPEPF